MGVHTQSHKKKLWNVLPNFQEQAKHEFVNMSTQAMILFY